jgi:hypothetical protein
MMLRDFRNRLIQIHLSELDVAAHHEPLSMATVWAVREIARLIPERPVIIESVAEPDAIDADWRWRHGASTRRHGAPSQSQRASRPNTAGRGRVSWARRPETGS